MPRLVQVQLVGIVESDTDDHVATAQEASDVTYFTDPKKKLGVYKVNNKLTPCISLHTAKGNYELEKHPTLNYYHGVCNGVKVQVSLKKIVGELRYWV